MFSAPVFLLFFNFALVASRIYVPYINIKYPAGSTELQPTDEGYKLLLVNYDGFFQEEVKEVALGELEIEGEYNEMLNNGLSIKVVYEAGRSGFVAKWRIYQPITWLGGASIASLKSRVG